MKQRPLPKILHTESSLGWGGQEIRILSEANIFISRGYSVTLVANSESTIFKKASAYSVPVLSAKILKKRVGDCLSIYRLLKQNSPDIVCTHSSTDHWLVALSRFFGRLPFKIVRFRHISTPVRVHILNRWLYSRGSDYVCTTSQYTAGRLITDLLVSPSKIRTVFTGIDLSYFKRPMSSRARFELGFPDDVVVVGTISTLRSWKGHRYLIEAANKETLRKGFVFVIVGTGPQEAALKLMVSRLELDNIVFFGHHDDIRPFLEAIDIFVFPSYANEGIPQALLQAQAYRLPIVTTDFDPLREALSNYDPVYYARVKSSESLSDGILELSRVIKKPQEEPAAEPTERGLSLEEMRDKLVMVFMQVMDQRYVKHVPFLSKKIAPVQMDRKTRPMWIRQQFPFLFTSGIRILDVGCGNAELRRYVDDGLYIGIDVTTSADLRLDLDSVKKLPFSDQEFNTTLCIETLEHLESPSVVANELFRVTKSCVLISLPNCWRDARVPIRRGYGTIAHYGSPYELAGKDKHRWFFNAAQGISYLHSLAPPNFSIDTMIVEPARNPVVRSLRRLILSETQYINKYSQTVYALYRRLHV
jgi:glycosyltransferase involved in cell wall biosynthesis/SAM-dependent methyltransferase